MDSKHICLAHYQQTTSDPKYSSLEGAPAPSKNKESSLIHVQLSDVWNEYIRIKAGILNQRPAHSDLQLNSLMSYVSL